MMRTRIAMALFMIMAAGAPLVAQPVRLAVMAGEGDRAPAEVTVAQLEAALTQEKEVTLLERTEVRKILAEQKLSAAGLTDSANAVALGKLIPAEVFLFIERLPKVTPLVCRVQVIEVRTGIVLSGDFVQEDQLASKDSRTLDIVKRGAAKQAVPADQRRYVGIVGIHNEDPGRSLDGTAEALSMFLATDLAQSREIILLDRDHLQQLTQEKVLTEIDQKLKVSSTLIEGGLRKSEDGESLQLRLNLQPLSGAETRKLTLTLPKSDMTAARTQVAAVVAKELKTGALPTTHPDPAVESARFLDQSKFLTLIGYKADALRAAEAAYALNRNDETHVTLSRALAAFVLEGDTFVLEGRTIRATSEAERIRSLNVEIRILTMACEQLPRAYPLEEGAAIPDDRTASMLVSPSAASLGIVLGSDTGEVRRLKQEVAGLRRRIYDHIARFALKDIEKRRVLYWSAMNGVLGRVFRGADRGQANLVIQGLREFLDALAAAGKPKDARQLALTWMDSVTGIVGAMQEYRPGRKPEADRAAFLAFFHELQSHPDPMMRLMAHGSYVAMEEDVKTSAYAVRDILMTELTASEVQDRAFFIFLLCMPQNDPPALSSYCEPLIGQWLGKDGNGTRLVAWDTVMRNWLGRLERAQRFAEADAIAARALEALHELQKQHPDQRPRETNAMATWLETSRQDWAKKMDRPPALAEPWSRYTLRPVKFDRGNKLNDAVVLGEVVGDRYYSVSVAHADGKTEKNATLTMFRFPEGGKPLYEVEFELPGVIPDSATHDLVSDAAIAPEAFYIGTTTGLIEISLATKRARLLTEADGLPGNYISAVAWYGGKLYMGFGNSDVYAASKNAFAAYDPKTGAAHILTSSADRTRSKPAKISRLVPDEKRKCLWVGSPKDGLYRYDPATGAMERKISTMGYSMDWISKMQSLPDGSDGLLLWDTVVGFVLINLDTCKPVWHAGDPRHSPWGCEGAPLLPAPEQAALPATTYDGDLFVGNTYLTIYSRDMPAAPNAAILQPRPLISTPYGVFMGLYGGRAMLLEKASKKEAAPAASMALTGAEK